tara:strand:- start:274 stop:513 length:240 start_codon:yes stop_codon:yes gene_type:complete
MDEKILTNHYLDLRGYSCPINFVKCCLALENLSLNESLKVDLDTGESGTTVMQGLKDKGYKVQIAKSDSKITSLIVSSD